MLKVKHSSPRSLTGEEPAGTTTFSLRVGSCCSDQACGGLQFPEPAINVLVWAIAQHARAKTTSGVRNKPTTLVRCLPKVAAIVPPVSRKRRKTVEAARTQAPLPGAFASNHSASIYTSGKFRPFPSRGPKKIGVQRAFRASPPALRSCRRPSSDSERAGRRVAFGTHNYAEGVMAPETAYGFCAGPALASTKLCTGATTISSKSALAVFARSIKASCWDLHDSGEGADLSR